MTVMDAPTQQLPPVNGRRGMPLDRIEAAAADVDFGRGAKRIAVAMVYYPARAVGAMVSGLGWMVAAWKVGYQDGRRGRREVAR